MLVSLIGSIVGATDYPFYYDSWTDVPSTKKTSIWPQQYFNMSPWLDGIEREALVKAGIEATCACRYSDAKCTFKESMKKLKRLQPTLREERIFELVLGFRRGHNRRRGRKLPQAVVSQMSSGSSGSTSRTPRAPPPTCSGCEQLTHWVTYFVTNNQNVGNLHLPDYPRATNSDTPVQVVPTMKILMRKVMKSKVRFGLTSLGFNFGLCLNVWIMLMLSIIFESSNTL